MAIKHVILLLTGNYVFLFIIDGYGDNFNCDTPIYYATIKMGIISGIFSRFGIEHHHMFFSVNHRT